MHRSTTDSLQQKKTSTRTRLVNKILEVLVREGLAGCDDSIHVGLHEICHNVHVLKVCRIRGNGHDVYDVDDIFVSVEMAKKFNLPHDALSVHQVAEHVPDLLDRDLAPLNLNT